MMISTRGRYALKMMIDLAEHGDGQYIPLKEIAERQNCSEKYLESIIAVLSKDGLLEGLRGKGGGYRLTKAPGDYSVGEILRLVEGPLSPVTCLEVPCDQSATCPTLPMWEKLGGMINDFLDSISIAEFVQLDG
ncbi:MAG: Rrf2 family transcriptional regulator [Clostridiales bacterium]|nr:Rrf2 family transcriptional regulator [Clostridiales bacterium]